MNKIFACNTNNTLLARVQLVNEADWLMKTRDSTCAEVSKTQPPSFVSRIFVTTYLYVEIPESLLGQFSTFNVKIASDKTNLCTSNVEDLYLDVPGSKIGRGSLATSRLSLLRTIWQCLQSVQNGHFPNSYLIIIHKHLPTSHIYIQIIMYNLWSWNTIFNYNPNIDNEFMYICIHNVNTHLQGQRNFILWALIYVRV
jgi:hypothetical protein